MARVFNQALKAGHVGFVTDTYIQCIAAVYKVLHAFSQRITWVFVQQWYTQQKVHLLNVNNIGQNIGGEIYSNTLFNRL